MRVAAPSLVLAVAVSIAAAAAGRGSLSPIAPRQKPVVARGGGARFKDHEGARKEGLPGALVPGIMAMGFLTSMIHHWSPAARVRHVDTVFRAPLIADEPCELSAVVTDVDEDDGSVQLDLTVKNGAGETRVFGTAEISLPTA